MFRLVQMQFKTVQITLAKLSVNSVDASKIAAGAVDLSTTDVIGVLSVAKGGTGNTVGAQEPLVSGTNIKSVNGSSLLSSGDLAVQPTLVSGTNIKTINGTTLLGSGDITISTGSLVYLLTVTGTNAATIDIEHAFDSTYDEYIIECPSLLTLTADQGLRVQFKMGGTYDTAANYGYSYIIETSPASIDSTANAYIYPNGFVSTTKPGCLSIKLFQPFSTSSKLMLTDGLFSRSDGTALPRRFTGAVVNKLTTALTGLRFFASTGNITGTFRLYGVKKS